MLNRRTLVTAALILFAFFLGFRVAPKTESPTPSTDGPFPAAERKILYWVDPMHPQYRSEKPGTAPDCGMDLVPVYEDTAVPEEASVPAGSLRIPSGKQQLIGVRYGEPLLHRGPLPCLDPLLAGHGEGG